MSLNMKMQRPYGHAQLRMVECGRLGKGMPLNMGIWIQLGRGRFGHLVYVDSLTNRGRCNVREML